MEFKRSGSLFVPDYKRDWIIPPRTRPKPGERYERYVDRHRKRINPSLAFAIITNGGAAGNGAGGVVTTGSLDTTGANLIVAFVSDFGSVGDAGVLTDSKSNSWTKLTTRSTGSTARIVTFYSEPSSVGSSHTFTYSMVGSYCSIAVVAVSGAAASPFDQENGATTLAASTLQTGSVTPSENDEILLTGLAHLDASATINSGFTILDHVAFGSGNNFAVSTAYLIQTTAGAVNPTWTYTSAAGAAEIATFKAGAGGGGFIAFPHPRGESGGMHRLGGGIN